MGYHHIAKPIYTPSVGQGNDKAVPERDRQDRRHILLTRAPSDMLETGKHPRRFTASRHATGLSSHLFKWVILSRTPFRRIAQAKMITSKR